MKPAFLLVNDGSDSAWSKALREALSSLGSLTMVSEDESKAEIPRERYDLVIVDAASVQKPTRLVSQLRAFDPQIRIIVVTVAPTWQEARAVLRAGAVDYIRRPSNKDELLSIIRNVLNASPIP